jgi:hypothetical protein
LLTQLVSVVAGLLCVLRPKTVRAFAARHHPDTAQRFASTGAHRRFIVACGWALLAMAAGSSITAYLGQP